MNFFLFDFNKHIHLIDSFLDSAALSHKEAKKSKEWFLWKFRDNPFGESVLACVEDNGSIVGCVAYGLQDFRIGDRLIKGAVSFETFVHPNYQGRGLFIKLIELAENKVQLLKITMLLNFPNSSSLKGFLNKGWKSLDVSEYWIKGKTFLSIPLNLTGLRKSFNPSPSNLKSLKPPLTFDFYPSSGLESQITLDYLQWRFFTFENTEYHYFQNEMFDFICRIGYRGKIKEAQVLFVNIKNNKVFKLSKLIKALRTKITYDIISFPISKNNGLRGALKKNMFIKVPNSTNVCYKIINTDKLKEKDVENISLSAINYHTY